MPFTVVFSPEAEDQLADLYQQIAEASSPQVASRFVGGIVKYCEGLRTLPHRGTSRDDIRPGLRITSFRKRVAIAFCVDASMVIILGVFYGGRNYEAALHPEQ